MDKYTALVILVVAVLAVGAYIFVNVGIPGTGGQPSNTISVQGTSEINAMPDLATVYLEIRAEDNDADDAKDKIAEIYDDVRVELIRLGLDNDDIQTESYNVYPNYKYTGGQRTITGYTASHRLKIISEDFDDVGEIIDVSVDKGALVNYINFELSDEKQAEFKKQALSEAAKDAKEKAEALAEGAGKRLGSLVTLQSSTFDYRPWMYYDVAASGEAGLKEAATNINPSEQKVSAYVTAVYKIK